MMLIAETPARVDLAGGTVDLYPLSAFLGGSFTVNAAIEVRSRVVLAPRADGAFRLASEDLDACIEAPKGSGLGASSALLVALLGGLRALEGRDVADDRLVDWAAAIEARLLQVPTGKQDYYAALLGGPLAIEFSLAGPVTERLEPRAGFLEQLERSALLFFTGEPHFSGAPNWAVLKRYVEGDAGTRRRLARISEIAQAMRGAVVAGDLERVAALLAAEWEERKGLAEGVSTPQLERIIGAARAAGALAAKACGAGGGGCLVVIAPPERCEAVALAAEREGAQRMKLVFARQGLRVSRAC